MAAERILSTRDGVTTFFSYDEMTDTSIIRTHQDVGPYLERNKRLANEGRHRTADRFMELAATIPNNIAYQWMIDDGINWFALPKHEKNKYLKRKLNDPDWRYLRTARTVF